VDSRERVLRACAFHPPDRIPRFDSFWSYPDPWRERLGPPEGLTDIAIWVPEEGTFPTRARCIGERKGWVYEVDGWGRTTRRRLDAYFVQTLEVPLPAGCDIDAVRFDSPQLDARYLRGQRDEEELGQVLAEAKRRHCVFGKTGGPYLRSTFVRGEAQFLTDIAADPPLARAIADKVADHLATVGAQEIQRWALQETGIWIYDDMAYNDGPMFSPAAFEVVFLPAYRRMVRAYKGAGARYVFLHSDGDIRPLLDMLIDAGIDGLHPLERRAGMDIVEIRARYPDLVLVGGMCNTDTLLHGPVSRIEAEARQIIDLGREGGVVIGTHSVSPEVPLAHLEAYHETCVNYGDWAVHHPDPGGSRVALTG
jgi:hypothetical protein